LSSTQVSLTWSASTDDVGVAGYKVFRNNTPIGTSASASFADSNLLASTTYIYAVAAVDQAGNSSALSTSISVTTNAGTPPPTLPIVAYSFDEGSGTVASDFSGNGNQCTLINGPTWAAG